MKRHLLYGGFLLVIIGGALVLFAQVAAPVSTTLLDESTAEFGGVSLRLDYATTTEARERGLSGRTSIPGDYGMLFVFPKDDRYGFWMKDTLVSLDMFWLDAQGQVVSIAREVATSSYPNVFYPSAPARYVLETAAGFADAHLITIGTPLRLKKLPVISQ
ncbi:MAG: DUF192 domain-containing protein [Candidatus Pacebacteria bacterium]|nr:DUF192 domain-containing protein [Candidatus Paceibacterota bacterium]